MKTRIIYTQVHFEDDWFNGLDMSFKYPFIYLFTNTHIGLTGIYRLTERVALLETGIEREDWRRACAHFQQEEKILFYEDWVYVVNANKYANYTGKKNYEATLKEMKSIPFEVVENFGYTIPPLDTVSGDESTPDTPINHKSKIINHKSYTKDHNAEEIDIDEVFESMEKGKN